MSKLAYVLDQVSVGAKIRVMQDSYGQEKVALTPRWSIFTRKIALEREELSQVKAALSKRNQGDKPATTVKF